MSNVQEKRPGRLSEGELSFMTALQQYLQRAISQRIPFENVVTGLFMELTSMLVSHRLDADSAIAAGYVPMLLAEKATLITEGKSAPSEAEIRFLEDMKGLAAFTVRNGIEFVDVFCAIRHDIEEIRAHNGSLAKTLADFVSPKVSGWARHNTEPVGDLED